MIVLGVVVCAAAVWMLLDAGHKPTDEEKFQQMVHRYDTLVRLRRYERSHDLPASFYKVSRSFQLRSYESYNKALKELVTSGYLAKLELVHGRDDFAEAGFELGTNCFWTVYRENNVDYFVCRSNDAPRIRALIEKKP